MYYIFLNISIKKKIKKKRGMSLLWARHVNAGKKSENIKTDLSSFSEILEVKDWNP